MDWGRIRRVCERETREREKIYVHMCAHTSLNVSFNRFFLMVKSSMAAVAFTASS